MVFEYANKKGKKYFLHGNGKLLYFSSEKKENAIGLPEGYGVVENSITRLPMLKKNK